MWSLLPPIFLRPASALQYDGWSVDAELHPYAALLTAWNDWLIANLESLLNLLASAADKLVERHQRVIVQTNITTSQMAIRTAVKSIRSC